MLMDGVGRKEGRKEEGKEGILIIEWMEWNGMYRLDGMDGLNGVVGWNS